MLFSAPRGVRKRLADIVRLQVILGGMVATGYQASQHVLGRRWVKVTLATMVVATVLAVTIVALRVATG